MAPEIVKKEAAITYIGIVAGVCDYAFRDNIEELVPRLLECASHNNIHLASSAVWAITKFLGLITSFANSETAKSWTL